MKKTFLYLATVTSLVTLFHIDATSAFLTSEKQHASAISTGTNEDVLITEDKEIVLKTDVVKKVKVKRTKKSADSAPTEERTSKVSIDRGAHYITFMPQRPHLDLEVENLKVTGAIEGDVLIEKVDSEKEDVITFRIAHADHAIGRKSSVKKGFLQITALGGFYQLSIPLTISTRYKEDTDVEDVIVPTPTPGTPDTPGGTTPPPSDPAPPPPPPTTDPGTPVPQDPGPTLPTPTPDTPPNPDTPPAPDTPTPTPDQPPSENGGSPGDEDDESEVSSDDGGNIKTESRLKATSPSE